MLEQAIARKAVVKAGEPGRELYYFPKGSVGKTQEWEAKEHVSRRQERTQDEYDMYAGMIGDFVNAGASS